MTESGTRRDVIEKIIQAMDALPTSERSDMPVVTLKSGLVIANFSSPHPFNFVTGEVLPGCSAERARRGSLDITEVEKPGIKGTTDIEMTPNISVDVRFMIAEAQLSTADVVLAPFMVIEAMKRAEIPLGKFRTIRVADRISKAIYSDRFCI